MSYLPISTHDEEQDEAEMSSRSLQDRDTLESGQYSSSSSSEARFDFYHKRRRLCSQPNMSAKRITTIASIFIGIVVLLSLPQIPDRIKSLSTSPSSIDQVVPFYEDSRIGQITLLYGSGSRWEGIVRGEPSSNFKAKEEPLSELNENQLALKIRQKYCEKWKYPLWVGTHTFLVGPERHHTTKTYTKQALVLSLIIDELRKPEGERLEWIFWFDADTVLVNDNVPLSAFLPPDTEYGRSIHVLIARDPWGTMNTGVYAVRVSALSVGIISSSIALPTVIRHKNWYSNGDQTAMTKTLHMDSVNANVTVVPGFWFNADSFALFDSFKLGSVWQPNYQYGDFMIHFMDSPKVGFRDIANQVLEGTNSTLLKPPFEETRYMIGNENISSFYEQQELLSVTERQAIASLHDAGRTFHRKGKDE